MGDIHERLDDKLRAFIAGQKMFFVASAPSGPGGSVNLSPKGYDSVAIIDDHTLAYLDFGGSGIETLAHVTENGRITLMWCAFEGPANILRIHGQGRAVSFDHPEFPALLALCPGFDRARDIIVVKITRIADSCGWGVPFYEFKGEREQLKRWVDNRSEEEWREKRYASNAKSIDGLPGLVRPE